MEPFQYHVYACEQKRPDGTPCCAARGAGAVIDALRRELAAQHLTDTVQLTTCGSLGLCERGPNLVVYPEGVWYATVRPEDVPEIVREHFQNGRPVDRLVVRDPGALRAEVIKNRDRALAAMRAREAAGVLPDDLSALVRGFMDSRVVLTGLELDVFTACVGGASAEEVSQARRTEPRATEILLDALVALGLLRKRAGVYENTPLAGRFLAEGAPDDARAALRHNLSLWRGWSDLTGCVRRGHPDEGRARGDGGPEDWTGPFIAAMHRNAQLRAPLVVKAVGTQGLQRLLDVGGGSGAYAMAFARTVPALRAEILDLEPVVPIARRHIEEAGLSNRVKVRTGDLRSDALGQGWDLVLMSAICHMLSPDENRDLVRRAFAALAPGGRIVIQDHVMSADRTAPRAGALFAVNMLVNTPAGRTYSEDEYAAWLKAAGFSDVARVALSGPNDLMIGKRPS